MKFIKKQPNRLQRLFPHRFNKFELSMYLL